MPTTNSSKRAQKKIKKENEEVDAIDEDEPMVEEEKKYSSKKVRGRTAIFICFDLISIFY